MAPFDRPHTTYIATIASSCIIFEIKRDIGRKSRFFSCIPAFDAFVSGVPVEKKRMVWLPEGEKSLMICLDVSIVYRRVTDGQTDGYLAAA